jgi:hypothetical protein
LGSLKKVYQRKGELASAWDLPHAKPIRGRHKESIFIFFFSARIPPDFQHRFL